MVSDINGINTSNTGGPLANGSGAVGKQSVDQPENTSTSPSSSPEDVVRLSPEAAELQALEDNLTELPAVDEARVEAIRQQIKNGDYQINPDRIAQKLIDADTYS